MEKKTVKITEVKIGDEINFWGDVNTVKEIELSPSGKTMRFKLEDTAEKSSYTTWWKVSVTVDIILQ